MYMYTTACSIPLVILFIHYVSSSMWNWRNQQLILLQFTYLQSISSVSSDIRQLPAYVPVCVRTLHAVLTISYLPCCLYVLGLDNKGWNISNIPKFVPCQEIFPWGNAIPLFSVLHSLFMRVYRDWCVYWYEFAHIRTSQHTLTLPFLSLHSSCHSFTLPLVLFHPH